MWAQIVGLALFLPACLAAPSYDHTQYRCSDDHPDCPSGLTCVADVCTAPANSAAPPDAPVAVRYHGVLAATAKSDVYGNPTDCTYTMVLRSLSVDLTITAAIHPSNDEVSAGSVHYTTHEEIANPGLCTKAAQGDRAFTYDYQSTSVGAAGVTVLFQEEDAAPAS
jgi:hypothetical protein